LYLCEARQRRRIGSSFAIIAGSRASGAVMIALSSPVSIGEGVRSFGRRRASSTTSRRARSALPCSRATISATSTASPSRQQS
jgi:hypothetical protein